jgi:hypothetical protein
MRRTWRRAIAVAAVAAVAAGLLTGGGRASADVVARETGTFPGYTLLVPQTTTETLLLDLDGTPVHTWRSAYLAGNSASLRDDGLLLRPGRVSPVPEAFQAAPGGQGGVIELLDWDSSVAASFEYVSDEHIQHHDAISLPNGNVAFLAWDHKTVDEAVAMGRDPALLADGVLLPDSVVEIDPDRGTVVWEWHVWDHLVQDFDATKPNYGDPSRRPRRIDLNYVHDGAASWNHLNGLAYDAQHDQIIVSSRHFSELWVIDHDTTTKQAAGTKGDLLARFGNPAAYGKGTAADRTLFFQHGPTVIPKGEPGAGKILVFNNGDEETRPFSTVDELTPKRRGGTFAMRDGVFRVAQERVYPRSTAAGAPMFAEFISGAERLPNGNTLIVDGPVGTVFEMTPGGTKVWEYHNDHFAPGPTFQFQGFDIRPERLFTVRRYAAGDPALKGRDLPPAAPRQQEYRY